jgi:hypothetical protein
VEPKTSLYAESAVKNLGSCRKSNPGLHFTEIFRSGDYLKKSLEIARHFSGIVWGELEVCFSLEFWYLCQ